MADRGFKDWKPRGESLERVDMARAILAEYRDYLPLTLRQVFYRAVGQYASTSRRRLISGSATHWPRLAARK